MKAFLAACALLAGAACCAGRDSQPAHAQEPARPAGSLHETAPLDEGARNPDAPPRRRPPIDRRGLPPRAPDSTALAALGAPCPEEGCPAGLTCLEYCGVAGCRSGSTFRTCEIPCRDTAQCPAGFTCGNLADGPGRVCRGGARRPAQPGELQ